MLTQIVLTLSLVVACRRLIAFSEHTGQRLNVSGDPDGTIVNYVAPATEQDPSPVIKDLVNHPQYLLALMIVEMMKNELASCTVTIFSSSRACCTKPS